MRFLHTMLRVGNLQRSIDFYTQVLGMQLLRTSENPEYRYSLAFVGYEGNPAQAEIELTHNWDTDRYEMGTATSLWAYPMHTPPVKKSRQPAAT